MPIAPNTKRSPLPTIADQLDTLRLVLEEVQRYIQKDHPHSELTDVGARLSLNSKHLESLEELVRGRIKSHLLEVGKTVEEGKSFFAVVQHITVTRLLTDKVKGFLGRKLSDFQTSNSEVRLTFKPKG